MKFASHPNPSSALPTSVSIVVIGRNEGQRLIACLNSIRTMSAGNFSYEIIYVDSASTDGSAERAQALGARVIRVHPDRPSAALGRNAGWKAASGEFILFLDGDTLLHPDFVHRALAEFRQPELAIVWGHRRELAPRQSLYVRVLDLDWIYPPGDSEFCGGDAMMRRAVLDEVEGFDASLIAGEEPEMCRRIRARGHRILHIDAPMTLHDLAIKSFAAYWRRAYRAGHAYAEISTRYRNSPDPLWQAQARRNFVHGSAVLLAPVLLLLSLLLPNAESMAIAIGIQLGLAFALLGRSAIRSAWKADDVSSGCLYALHSHIQQVPILFGQLARRLDARRGLQRRLIEYKESAGKSC